jgi:hypothetical protein
MKDLLKKVKQVKGGPCVSIIFNTHRTKPDNLKDPIVLRNLIKEAEARLSKEYDKHISEVIGGRLHGLAEQFNHNYNLDSMVIYANPEMIEFTRLPVQVEDRVIIDDTFATRDLIRAMDEEARYYVLVLSRQQARLIEAYNDKVVKELDGEFPITDYKFTTDKLKLTMAQGQDHLIEEFFNQVDKRMQEAVNGNPLPLVLASETRNYDHFMKVVDKPGMVIGHINKNRDDAEAHHIVTDAWKTVHEVVKARQQERVSELKKAVSAGMVLSDFSDIWRAIEEGRGQTLFVKKGFFQPARVEEGGRITPVDNADRNKPDVVDDVIDEMIERNLAHGGDTVFLEGDELVEFQNAALITRY